MVAAFMVVISTHQMMLRVFAGLLKKYLGENQGPFGVHLGNLEVVFSVKHRYWLPLIEDALQKRHQHPSPAAHHGQIEKP
jgi:hypothetical protein